MPDFAAALPRLGQLRIRELSVGTLNRHLHGIADTHGVTTARMCRSALSGMCTLAARHDALAQNPVRALGPITGWVKTAPRALTVPQLRQLRAALTYDDRAIARDLPDLLAFLMATGLRIGKACGLTWNAADLQAGTIEVRAAAVRVRGQGLVVKTTKTDAGTRTLVLPRWCVGMLRERAARPTATADDRGGRPVFPHPWAAGATRPTPRPTCGTPSLPRASTGSPATPSARPWPPSWTRPGSPLEQPPTSSVTPTPP
ncbi:Phage integrase family protein [Geodermatophilus obscurus]|uniref:Phage integrase family protein n=1 Tax=Geodermatophilus obscurus TaxID=1861 RepID=A0A1M7S475_9ACTN|nr:Phage integrase family protein [Geodermatophilus obscurus]